MSHPAWVCGLKQEIIDRQVERVLSHPAWVCGLKHERRFVVESCRRSHPAWVCGLKHKDTENEKDMLSHTLRGCVD